MSSIAYESYWNYASLVSTGNQTTFQDVLTRSFSPQYQQDFCLFGGYANKTNNLSNSSESDFILTNGSLPSLGLHNHLLDGSDTAQPGGFWFNYIEDMPINSYTLRRRHRNLTANGGAWITDRDNFVLAIGGMNFEAKTSFISAVTIGTTEVDTLSLTFTPDAGDYLIFASNEAETGLSSTDVVSRFYIDGDEKMIDTHVAGSDRVPGIGLTKKETFTNAEHTVKITGQTISGTNKMKNQFIAVIKV